ncbi:MAG: PAS domain S-box protein [Acidobacteriia bacterium]|nr:PAS domain S-box protein [Terriglobia bacterium]
MSGNATERRWLWATLTLSCITMVAVVFAVWELVEYRYFRDADYLTLHYLYITRGMGSSLLLAFWAAWYVLRQRKASEEALRRSQEWYRGMLEVSPGAVALYDAGLCVAEWNAAAERLYGFSKKEAVGAVLPTVPPENMAELQDFISSVQQQRTVLDAETRRSGKDGKSFEVQLSLIPFRGLSGEPCFLEITYDIRERVRLRQTLLELEKLTTMGQMAAGTAHHLNTPLAAMLLRVQMMRERSAGNGLSGELEEMEASIGFCHQFVQRLLTFSRRPQPSKQVEQVKPLIESVASFLSPQLLAKHARLELQMQEGTADTVFGDRNELEALFLILVSNSLDAINGAGTIRIRCRNTEASRLRIEIADNGCGMERETLAHIFEPFFTTKAPGCGTGLGLAIAANILRDHGGSIGFESTPKQGTTAIVELPVCEYAAVEERGQR